MPERELWQEVLSRTIADARLDPSSWPIPESAYEETAEARKYLTTPSKDLATVCSLAGVESDALVERMQRRVAGVPILSDEGIQTRRKRGKTLTHEGKTVTVLAWSKITGLTPSTIYSRLRHGWPLEDVLRSQ
ncbi:hypothetical protein [Pseudorhodobacter sp. MZDSW-24AT]|uniref:hypothetical protein n=1 Tax=Pseudorhodobacter sp. MZDSW-24AT TaxID=2052957 RepID=UPI000C1E2288|nr:hypothetical protein [Pseudorhodobacter sp. MZDSW-24AT]PJF10787.1 hypothetical protein CUR21_02190 [Pseudorhodobacter sp. MZDSW-24AT]